MERFRRSYVAKAIALTVISWCATAFGQDLATRSLHFEELLAQTLAHSPEVRQIDAQMAQRISEALEVRLLPNPELSGSYAGPLSNRASGTDNISAVELAQPISISYFGLRQTLSRLVEKAGSLEKGMALLSVTANLRLAYLHAWALERQRFDLQAARKQIDSIGSELKQGVQKGLMPLSEQLVFEAEAKKKRAELLGLESSIGRSRAELVRLSGVSLGRRELAAPATGGRLEKDVILRRAADTDLVVQRRMLLLRDVAAQYERLAQREAYPQLVPRFTYEHSEEGSDFLGGGLTIPLPFFNRNQPEKSKRQAESAAASANARYYQSETFREQLELSLQAIQAAERQVDAYEREVIPALGAALQEYRKQLNAGQAVVLQIWQTQRELLSAKERFLELVVRLHTERTELGLLIGELL